MTASELLDIQGSSAITDVGKIKLLGITNQGEIIINHDMSIENFLDEDYFAYDYFYTGTLGTTKIPFASINKMDNLMKAMRKTEKPNKYKSLRELLLLIKDTKFYETSEYEKLVSISLCPDGES